MAAVWTLGAVGSLLIDPISCLNAHFPEDLMLHSEMRCAGHCLAPRAIQPKMNTA